MCYNDFDTAEKRYNFIVALQDHLIDLFGADNYNIFVFGSFPTSSFTETSDLDLGIYSLDPVLMGYLSDEIRKFAEGKIDVDIIYIHTDSSFAHIDLEPLLSEIMFTDYYPNALAEYCVGLLKPRIRRNDKHEFYRLRIPKVSEDGKFIYEPSWY